MQRRQKQSLADLLVVWGFVFSLLSLMGAGCFEAYKIVAAIPAAFESSSGMWDNPMNASDQDYQQSRSGRRRMTPRQRADQEEQQRQNQ
jgi:hypothetical protein